MYREYKKARIAMETEAEAVKDGNKSKKTFKSSVVLVPPEDVWGQIQDIRRVHDTGFKRWMPHINLIYPFIPDKNDGQDFTAAASHIQQSLTAMQSFRVVFNKESFGYFRHKKKCTLWLRPILLDNTDTVDKGGDDVSVKTRGDIESKESRPDGDVVNQAASGDRQTLSNPDTDPPEDQQTPCKSSGASVPAPEAEDEGAAAALQHLSKKQRKKAAKEAAREAAREAALAATMAIQHHPSVIRLQSTIEGLYPGFEDLSTISAAGFQPHLSLGQFSPATIDKFMAEFQEAWQDIEFTVTEIYLISRADYDDPFHIRHTVKLSGGL